MDYKRFSMIYGKYYDNETGIEYDEKWESWKICELLNELAEENNELKKENEQLKQLNIPVDEIEETVSDIQGRIITIYYKR